MLRDNIENFSILYSQILSRPFFFSFFIWAWDALLIPQIVVNTHLHFLLVLLLFHLPIYLEFHHTT